ncbi:hypothetical protein GCM10023149_24870 [Mucilaginibacter gynuensis]|uniref:Uncharacterized protein n=1 Tax=Mucilaginibacter gynuensis TaxID=1302236 RepID=A0ABP8GGP2_9SPHI
MLVKTPSAAILILALFSCNRPDVPVLAPEYLHNVKNLKVITSMINTKDSTISILYGNEQALRFSGDTLNGHQPGEEFEMVTWEQKPMPHWYGTNMNGRILFIETVKVNAGTANGVNFKYALKQGPAAPFIKPKSHQADRINLITRQVAAVFPF